MAKKKSPDLHSEIQSMMKQHGAEYTIKTLTRRANRRLERASQGQRKALEYYIRERTGESKKFSASYAGMTKEQQQAKIDILERFLAGKSTTKEGWKQIKASNAAKANRALGLEGYELTDEELAEILEQVDSDNYDEKYRAINLVQAAKYEAELAGKEWFGSEEAVEKAIMAKFDADAALQFALNMRKNVEANRAAMAEKQAEIDKQRKQLEKQRAQVGLRVDLQRGKRRKK